MPLSLQEILDRQDELTARLENYEPEPDDERDPAVFRRLLAAASNRVKSEATLAEAVAEARTAGYSWALIGSTIGTTGQAAQQRYGRLTVGA